MKNLFRVILTLSLFVSTAWTDDATSKTTSADSAKAMLKDLSSDHAQAWTAAVTPGEQHKLLEQFVGNWSYTLKMWKAPGEDAEDSTGAATIESIFGGKFIKQTATGQWAGQQFEGVGFTGFDNLQKYFNSVWIDNVSTAMMIGKGSWDEKTKSITDTGTISCPFATNHVRDYRAVWTLPKNNTFTYEIFSKDDNGKEFKMMAITYKKVA
ncbi:MAG TPA: DUF1579 domain-containing protein [Oligoflexia bacterium]|nr:DUF1579 domain-containing protein [Oligoflexia bacterium]HMP27422.1 DUF1579 domain-containing protein [Oligoflexia bacterium]